MSGLKKSWVKCHSPLPSPTHSKAGPPSSRFQGCLRLAGFAQRPPAVPAGLGASATRKRCSAFGEWLRLYTSPFWPPTRTSVGEWRWEGLAGDILKWISWGFWGGSVVFAFPSCIVSSSFKSPVFLWESSTFCPYGLVGGKPNHQPDLGPLTYSTLCPLRWFQRWTCNRGQVRMNLHPDFAVRFEKSVLTFRWSCWDVSLEGEGDLFSPPPGRLAWERQHKGRQIPNSEKIKWLITICKHLDVTVPEVQLHSLIFLLCQPTIFIFLW